MTWNWNTYGDDDSFYDVVLRYRTHNDNGNWANAQVIYDGELFLSPNRGSYAPCSTNATGVKLTSGSDCIIVTRSIHDLAEVGWGDRSNLQACINGNVVAWLYDGVSDQLGNYPKYAYVVDNTGCKSLGNNISSVNIKDTANPPPTVPGVRFAVDANTVHLWHLDEVAPGNPVTYGATVYDALGTLNGVIYEGSGETGRFGNAYRFNNPPDWRKIMFDSMDVCPMTFEGWIRLPEGYGSGRLAGQLANNTGPAKWLLSLDSGRPRLEI